MNNIVRSFISDQNAATAIEYGLLAAIMGIGVLTGAMSLSSSLGDLYTWIISKYPNG